MTVAQPTIDAQDASRSDAQGTMEAGLDTDLGIFVLPPVLDDEPVPGDDTRVNSEGYTSRIYMCCY